MNDDELAGKEYLGRGWSFPVRWQAATDLRRAVEAELVAAEEDVRQAILILLRTGVDERVMHPGFGEGIDRFVFQPNNSETQFRLQQDVERALLRFEPRIVVESVTADPNPEEEARLDVTIEYRLDAHRRPQSLVFPFYVLQARTA
jgi:phage baseplate assembly protein W